MNAIHLIIGGTTKSGTTSLFRYLGDHPEVCSSSMKETRFFLDKEYPLESKHRYEDGVEKYQNFFKHHNSEKVLMEATPDYLYSKNTAEKIKSSIPNAKLIFILREPKSRFISWFNFSKQIGKLNSETSLEEYIEMQLMNEDATQEQHLLALQQGNYSTYLQWYYNHFQKSDIYICFFEDLASEPLAFMTKLALFLNIDSEFYKTYGFEKHNSTISIKNQSIHKKYLDISYSIRKFTHNKKFIHSTLKSIKKIFNPIYEKYNSQQSKSNGITDQSLKKLDKFYAKENRFYQEHYQSLHQTHN